MTLLEVEGLGVCYRSQRAVSDVTFTLDRGQTLGLVGESGSGKSTTARAVLRLVEPSEGRVRVEGQDVLALNPAELRTFRRRVQLVFQDPYASLNPRLTVAEIVAEPLRVHHLARGDELRRRVGALLEQVGLGGEYMDRYPHQFSGGQRQRIGIARALATEPVLLVADEPVSALDVSIQAQVLNLLADLQEQLGLAIFFITHDLAVVRQVSHRVAVMYAGRLVEVGPCETVCSTPLHHYTQELLASADPRRRQGPRQVRAASSGGCSYAERCPAASARCREEIPRLVEKRGEHLVACHHPVTEKLEVFDD